MIVKDKDAVEKALDRFLIQQAREQQCTDDDIALVVYNHLKDTRYF